jgi:hypothetical protein
VGRHQAYANIGYGQDGLGTPLPFFILVNEHWAGGMLEGLVQEETMIRLIAVAAFTLAIATSAHAMTLAPLHQSDGMITQVRHACGAGMHMVNGHCVTTVARRRARRCPGLGCRACLP